MGEASNTCPRCGAAFICGMQAGGDACWCAAFPAAFAVPAAGAAACYCPRCLATLIADAQVERMPGADGPR